MGIDILNEFTHDNYHDSTRNHEYHCITSYCHSIIFHYRPGLYSIHQSCIAHTIRELVISLLFECF